MGVDKETAPNYVNFWIEDNPQMLKELRKAYKEEGCDPKDTPQLVLCDMNGFSIESEEFYLDDNKNGIPELLVMFGMQGTAGKVTGTITIPLSDVVLIDILQYAIKKINKLKTAMETLK